MVVSGYTAATRARKKVLLIPWLSGQIENIAYPTGNKDVSFVMNSTKKTKIDYVHHNFVLEPARIALIDAAMFHFEGLDSSIAGRGGMKAVTLIEQQAG